MSGEDSVELEEGCFLVCQDIETNIAEESDVVRLKFLANQYMVQRNFKLSRIYTLF